MPPSVSQPGPPSGPQMGGPPSNQPGQFGGARPTPPMSQPGPPSGPTMGMPSQPPQPGMMPPGGGYTPQGQPGMPPPPGAGYPPSGQPGAPSRPGYPSSQPPMYGPGAGNHPQGDGYNAGQYNSMPNIGGMNLSVSVVTTA